MKFDYYEPATLREATEMLAHYGPEAQLLAGGTDLVVRLRLGLVQPRAIISLQLLEDLKGLQKKSDGSLKVGAMTTLREVERAPELAGGVDLIRQGAGCVSSMQVRNVATLGGNCVNASPAADTVPGLMAAEAVMRIVGPEKERRLPLEEFFLGPGRTALQKGEVLAAFEVPAPPPRTGGAYKKFALRGEVDMAIVGVAVRLTLDEGQRVEKIRIVLGGVAPTSFRARHAEELLTGEHFEEKLLAAAAEAAAEESSPITDQRATAHYRREMVRVWTRHALREAWRGARDSCLA